MVQEDRKILNPIWYRKHKWVGHVLQHDGLLRDVLQGRMLGKRRRGRRRTQLIDWLEKKNYTDLKKAAEDRSIWRTIRNCHKPAAVLIFHILPLMLPLVFCHSHLFLFSPLSTFLMRYTCHLLTRMWLPEVLTHFWSTDGDA